MSGVYRLPREFLAIIPGGYLSFSGFSRLGLIVQSSFSAILDLCLSFTLDSIHMRVYVTEEKILKILSLCQESFTTSNFLFVS